MKRGRERERNERGHDERRAQVEQEDEEHQQHQQRALDQVVPHRLQGGVDQLGAIVERAHLRAVFGERAR